MNMLPPISPGAPLFLLELLLATLLTYEYFMHDQGLLNARLLKKFPALEEISRGGHESTGKPKPTGEPVWFLACAWWGSRPTCSCCAAMPLVPPPLPPPSPLVTLFPLPGTDGVN